jgi:glycosyltransferase involved in cell wall biosynthesis
LRRAIRDFDPDVVQVHESDVGLGALWLRRSRTGRRPLLVALQQVSYVEERRAVRPLRADAGILGVPGAVERRFRRFKAPLQIALGRWTARATDCLLVPSRATGVEIARDYGVDTAGVLPNVTGGLAVEAEAVPGLGEEHSALLFVGRLRIRKGVEVLLEALRGWSGPGQAPALWIAGDGEHRAALESAAGSRGLTRDGRVRFLGRMSAGQVRTLLGRSAALVVPSIYEGMPLVVLEAMELGLPVVASRVSGIPEVVIDGETGWLVEPEAPGALRLALEEIVRDPAESARRGEAGHRRLERCYRPRHAAEAWEQVIAAAQRGEAV